MTENIGHAKGTTGRVVTSFRITIFTANTYEFRKNGFDTFRVTFSSHVWNKRKRFFFSQSSIYYNDLLQNKYEISIDKVCENHS